jgi:hypothetical protein
MIIKVHTDSGEEAFVADVVDDVRRNHGITEDEVVAEAGAEVVEKGVQNWAWVQAALSVLDRKVPGRAGTASRWSPMTSTNTS